MVKNEIFAVSTLEKNKKIVHGSVTDSYQHHVRGQEFSKGGEAHHSEKHFS